MNVTSDALLSRHFPLIVLTLLGSQVYAPDANTSELSGVAALTSEYIYRGLALSDGDPAFQLGLDYEHDTGLFIGVWASTIDLSSAMGQRDMELDYYAGFHYAAQAPLAATITVLRYTYPGQTGAHSYNHNEVLVGATWREHYSIELGYTSDLYGLGRIGRHWELRSGWPVAHAWVISAALGGNDLRPGGYLVDHALKQRQQHAEVLLRPLDDDELGVDQRRRVGQQAGHGLQLAAGERLLLVDVGDGGERAGLPAGAT